MLSSLASPPQCLAGPPPAGNSRPRTPPFQICAGKSRTGCRRYSETWFPLLPLRDHISCDNFPQAWPFYLHLEIVWQVWETFLPWASVCFRLMAPLLRGSLSPAAKAPFLSLSATVAQFEA